MVRDEDRISNLPDELLQSIVCLLPLKFAIRTSTLSKRWKGVWQFNLISSSSFQFDRDFSCNQSPKQFATVLDRYFDLHANRNLDKFSILFSPFDLFFPNLERWIRAAIEKGVKELDVDLSQGIISSYNDLYVDERTPFVLSDSIFDSNNLTQLSLTRCDFPNPFDFSKFVGLNSLSLDHVNITDEMLTNTLQSCVSLEFLSLTRCGSLGVVKFIGENLKLQKLVMVDCRGVYDMEISAPKLESFLYYGVVSFSHVFGNLSKLNDAYFCSIGLEDYDTDEELFRVLSEFAHVKVLTLCSIGLMSLVVEQEYNEDDFPLELRNLQELQLIMDSLCEEHLSCMFSFFHLCPSPFLEKLLISLPCNIDTPVDITDAITAEKDTPHISFDNLKWIQITHFEGSMLELKLVKFLLENSPVLESLILVSKECDNTSKDSLFLRIVQGQLSVLQKASKGGRIVLCGPSDHEFIINPLHNMLYHEKNYRAGTTVHLDYASIGDSRALPIPLNLLNLSFGSFCLELVWLLVVFLSRVSFVRCFIRFILFGTCLLFVIFMFRIFVRVFN